MTSRRQFTALLASGAALSSAKSTRAQSAPSYDGPDKWMQEWIDGTKAAKGFLYLARFQDPIYIVTKPLGWQPSGTQDSSLLPVTVPFGFVTDLASIPRLFWSALRPDGNYAYAAIVHDYLYWDQPKVLTRTDSDHRADADPRATADQIFKYCMLDTGVAPKTAETIYLAVRAGGQQAWNDNAKLKASGERRLLKKFPDDPSITWAQWKARDVF